MCGRLGGSREAALTRRTVYRPDGSSCGCDERTTGQNETATLATTR